jgi:Uri superfamily endonuclease
MNSKPGTYALVLRSNASACARIGSWGRLDVRAGYYIYVGSAFGPGGVLARVSRHCREPGSKHWHIDYLREHAVVESVWYSHSSIRLEHSWAEAVTNLAETESIKGFGCSDCRCESHLFFSATEPRLARFVAVVGEPVESWVCEGVG